MIDLDMSPYAAFVWPAWAVTALALGVLVARTAAAARRWSRELKGLERETAVPEDDR
ncbi:heme exporter protein CcmD [Brevundimonas sp. VNH65]|uniref:heme exporter protein CcmD n=1 Tax=Brevundimonas sp. VNH65 TaxID=3400917 RepID=UPI003C0B5566